MSHWYNINGEAQHTQPNKSSGGTRPTTIRDARKHGLFPSVTTILDIIAKPFLLRWQQEQVAKWCYNNPRYNVDEDEYVNMAIARSKDQVVEAADIGTAVHNGIEDLLVNGEYDSNDLVTEDHYLSDFVDPAKDWLDSKGVEVLASERTLVNKKHGFAGTVDLYGTIDGDNYVIDFKTCRTKEGEKKLPNDSHPLQIAAYAKTIWPDQPVHGINLYISTTEVGRIEYSEYSTESIEENWQTFLAILKTWQRLKKYNPNEPV